MVFISVGGKLEMNAIKSACGSNQMTFDPQCSSGVKFLASDDRLPPFSSHFTALLASVRVTDELFVQNSALIAASITIEMVTFDDCEMVRCVIQQTYTRTNHTGKLTSRFYIR